MTYDNRESEAEAVRRLSTPSWGLATQRNKPFVTEWLWYWSECEFRWQVYTDSQQIEEAFQANQDTFEFYKDETGYVQYELRFKGTWIRLDASMNCALKVRGRDWMPV